MTETCYICKRTKEEIESDTNVIQVAWHEFQMGNSIRIKVCVVCASIISDIAKEAATEKVEEKMFRAIEERTNITG